MHSHLIIFLLIIQLLSNLSPAAMVLVNTARFSVPVVTAPTPQLLWWKLNENTGTDIGDSSTASPPTTGNILNSAQWATGQAGNGVAGNGSAYYLQTSNQVNFAANVLTITFWHKDSAYNALEVIAEHSVNYNGGTQNSFLIYTDTDGKIHIGIRDTAGGYLVQSGTAGSTGSFHHYAIVLDNSSNAKSIKCYVDGSVISLADDSPPSGAASGSFTTQRIYFLARGGSTGVTFPSDATLDDITISNVELSPAQIADRIAHAQ